MISLFDANFLLILFDPQGRVPSDRETGMPLVERARERIDFLVSTLGSRREKIIIPAPALAEFLLLTKGWDAYLTEIKKKAVFQIAGFNQPEAIELVIQGKIDGKKIRNRVETWAKLKYDRQIVAIAKTHRVEVIYSADRDIHRLAAKNEIACKGLADLPLPPPQQLRFKELAIPGAGNEKYDSSIFNEE